MNVHWQAAQTDRARRAFATVRTRAETTRRAAEIATLDAKDWHGQRVFRLTCRADFGKGPHDQFVPEGLLWSLIDLRVYRCPFHRL